MRLDGIAMFRFGGPQPPPVKPDLRRKRGHGEIEGDDKSTEEVSDKNPSEVKQSAPSEDKATSETGRETECMGVIEVHTSTWLAVGLALSSW